MITAKQVENNLQNIARAIGFSNPSSEVMLSFAANKHHPAGLLFIIEESGGLNSHLIIFIEGYGFVGGLYRDYSPKGHCKLIYNNEVGAIIVDSQDTQVAKLNVIKSFALPNRVLYMSYDSEYSEYNHLRTNNYASYITVIPEECFIDSTKTMSIDEQRKIEFTDEDFDELINCIHHNKNHIKTIADLICEWEDWSK